MKISIVGGGILGMTCAYHLSRRGHEVTVHEAAPQTGGLAASDRREDGTNLDTHPHLYSPSDTALIELLATFELTHELSWRPYRQALFCEHTFWPFTTPLDLVRFTPLSLGQRIRFARSMFGLARKKRWEKFDLIPARDWLIKKQGLRTYETVWQHLFEERFTGCMHALPLSWVWAAAHNRSFSHAPARARKITGYFKRGSRILFDALERSIVKNGGSVLTNSSAQRVRIVKGTVVGVETALRPYECDAVVLTVPMPIIKTIVPELASTVPEKIAALGYRAIQSVCLELTRPFTDQYLTEICDPTIPLCRVCELTHIEPASTFGHRHIVWLSRYLSPQDPLVNVAAPAALDAYWPYIAELNKNLTRGDVLSARVHTYEYADPLYFINYARAIPPVQTAIRGLYLANTTQIYPWPRTVNACITHATRAAQTIGN